MFILAYLVFIRQTTTRRWCSLFNADLALSVTMTAISTILSTVMLPLNLLLYTSFAFGHDSDDVIQMIDFTALFVSLAVVIGAIGLGILLTDRIDSFNFSVHANRVSTRKIGILCSASHLHRTTSQLLLQTQHNIHATTST
jgi:predicted Na+-dependent transporter